MYKIVLVAALIVLSLSLKASQVGVNDWAIKNIGQLRDVSFSRNKIHFVSYLNSIGILDKATGELEARSSVTQNQKVVGQYDMILTAVTRYNQVVSHFITATGLDKRASNQFKIDGNKTIQWLVRFDQNEYFITKSSFHHGRELIIEATNDTQYLRVIDGRDKGERIIYLLSRNDQEGTYCIQSYAGGWRNKNCIKSGQELKEFQFYQGNIFLGLSHSTIILSSQLTLLDKFTQKYLQLTSNTVIMPSKSYNIAQKKIQQKRPIKSNKKDVIIYLKQQNNKIIIFKDDIELFSFQNYRKTSILRVWLNFRSDMQYDLVIQFSDLQLVCYYVLKSNVDEVWKRQESLAYTQNVIFMKYHQTDTLDNEYHRSLLLHTYKEQSLMQKLSQIPQNFIMRITQQIIDIKHIIIESINYFRNQISNIDSKSIRKFEMPPQQEIKYGLRKYLIIATQYKTIIAVDSKFHSILWKINREDQSQIVQFVHLKRDYQTQVALLVSYSADKSLTVIEEITEEGEIKQLQTFTSDIVPLIYKLNDHNVIIKFGERIQKFGLFKQDDLVDKEFYFYTQSQRKIQGWKAVDDSVIKIWNFQTRNDEQILKIASAFRGDQTANIPLFDNSKVFFKNVDFTNMAVLTSYNKNVALYIINGRTGKIQYNTFKNSTSLNMPINLIYDENNVLVSYFNHRNKNFQIWTVQQYQQRIQTSALNMIKDFIQGNKYKPQESKQKTIFEQEVYGSPVNIKYMEVSQSKMSLTRRNLFIITGDNKLYTVNRDLVSTRRPKKNANSYFANQKFPQHAYFLPLVAGDYLSYNLQLSTLNKIVFNPTDMESTIFTLCYGRDLFMIRNAPDKTFDMITESFNHVVLVIILVVATAGIVLFKRIMDQAKKKKPHIE